MGFSFSLHRLAGASAAVATLCWIGVVELLIFGPTDTGLLFWTCGIIAIAVLGTRQFLKERTGFWKGFALLASLNLILEAVGVFFGSGERVTSVVLLAGVAGVFTLLTIIKLHFIRDYANVVEKRKQLEAETDS